MKEERLTSESRECRKLTAAALAFEVEDAGSFVCSRDLRAFTDFS
jgi:hypothetical protein